MWPCPLCQNIETSLHFEDRKRIFIFCPQCYLIFVPQQYHCGTDQEKARYDHHNNHPESQTYPAYQKWMEDFLFWCSPQGEILDYGCGIYPVMSHLLKRKGIPCDCYDPYYFSDLTVLREAYDSLLVSEVVEHFRQPAQDWTKMLHFLKDDGHLFIRTSFWDKLKDWKNWSYQRDVTHVTFYHQKTLTYLSEHFRLDLVRFENDKVEFRRVRT